MSVNSEQSQEQQVITLLKNLLKENDAHGIREDLNAIFYGYISSEYSDYSRDRSCSCGTYINLVEFFTKISKFKEINPYG